MKHIGFTGTQYGMSPQQRQFLREGLIWMERLETANGGELPTFHHGCCIGADEEAHFIARELDFPVIGHPPLDTKKMSREVKEGPKVTLLEPKEYLDRNHDIVDACELLIAAPLDDEEVLRSGTWATIRYAKKHLKPVIQLERK